MSITSKGFSNKLFWTLVATLLTYFGVQSVIGEIVARKYAETFGQFQHPAHTALVDSLRFDFSYYPATYVDDSIKPNCADLTGEVRTYTDDWNSLGDFYANATFRANNADLKVNILPLNISSDAVNFILDDGRGYHPSPSDFDIIDPLQSHYSSNRISQQLKPDKHYYLVYVLADKPCH